MTTYTPEQRAAMIAALREECTQGHHHETVSLPDRAASMREAALSCATPKAAPSTSQPLTPHEIGAFVGTHEFGPEQLKWFRLGEAAHGINGREATPSTSLDTLTAENEKLRAALAEYARAGVGNSTDWHIQLSALRMATAIKGVKQ